MKSLPTTTAAPPDPMQERAAFIRPLSSPALQASDSPVLTRQQPTGPTILPMREAHQQSKSPEGSITPSYASSENRASAFSSMDTLLSAPPQKRQPRKLTKHRSSESTIERENKAPEHKRASSERPRGVLTKRTPQPKSATSSAEELLKTDGVGGNACTSKNEGKRRSLTLAGATLKDKIFPP